MALSELRGRQFDLGLARVSFPEGSGGRGLPPGLQRLVDDRLAAAGTLTWSWSLGLPVPTSQTHRAPTPRGV